MKSGALMHPLTRRCTERWSGACGQREAGRSGSSAGHSASKSLHTENYRDRRLVNQPAISSYDWKWGKLVLSWVKLKAKTATMGVSLTPTILNPPRHPYLMVVWKFKGSSNFKHGAGLARHQKYRWKMRDRLCDAWKNCRGRCWSLILSPVGARWNSVLMLKSCKAHNVFCIDSDDFWCMFAFLEPGFRRGSHNMSSKLQGIDQKWQK